ncbi:hypothetical protein IR073_06610 [Gemella sp. 19428wG2_WT2a]|nr:hypothetical protein [Gemella sp. 19428wG2_WT2a]TFU57706.1 hypothetical protein E4T67_06535 [Gemella sp. WT2a]
MNTDKYVLGDFIRFLEKKRGIKNARQRVFLIRNHTPQDMQYVSQCCSRAGKPLTKYNTHRLRKILGLTVKEMRSLVLEMKGGENNGKED